MKFLNRKKKLRANFEICRSPSGFFSRGFEQLLFRTRFSPVWFTFQSWTEKIQKKTQGLPCITYNASYIALARRNLSPVSMGIHGLILLVGGIDLDCSMLKYNPNNRYPCLACNPFYIAPVERLPLCPRNSMALWYSLADGINWEGSRTTWINKMNEMFVEQTLFRFRPNHIKKEEESFLLRFPWMWGVRFCLHLQCVFLHTVGREGRKRRYS